MIEEVLEYNRRTSRKYGWKPSWFDCIGFDIELITAVRAYQRFNKLKDDGMVGPGTFRRIFADREKNIDDHLPLSEMSTGNKYIIHGSEFIPIEWEKVVLWSEDDGLEAQSGAFKRAPGRRNVAMFVNHWDVCLSSRACQRVLNNRGISVHFLIDNDGTIYQTMDTQHIAYHAGSKGLNACTVGVEISNAYYLRHNKWYSKNGFGRRPIVSDGKVNGAELEPFLDFYDIQKQALKALWKACNKAMNIPLQTVLDDQGNMSTNTEHISSSGNFRGIVHHYHLTNKKIDCAGLDIKKLLKEIDNG
jgi:hypothetical protein